MFGALSWNQTTVAPAFRQQGDGAHVQKQCNRCEFIQDGTISIKGTAWNIWWGFRMPSNRTVVIWRTGWWLLTMFANSQERDGRGRFPKSIFRLLFNQNQTSSLWTHIDWWLNLFEYHMNRYPNSKIMYSSTYFRESPKWPKMHIMHHVLLTSLFSSRL